MPVTNPLNIHKSHPTNYACIYKLIWEGIEIELLHTPRYAANMDHIAVHSKNRTPLPITKTGYKSIFILPERLCEYDDPIGLVKPWLDEEAKAQSWQLAQNQGRQMSLF